MSNLKIEAQVVDEVAKLLLEGSIDEDSHFDKITDINGAKEYHFDFDKVKLINSCGIREWINLLDKLGSNCQIKYFNCPQVIIEQMNMVHGFVPSNASIESFYAPYYDEDSDEEVKILLKKDQVKDKKAPEVKNPSNGNDLEFDAIEEQYFSFLK